MIIHRYIVFHGNHINHTNHSSDNIQAKREAPVINKNPIFDDQFNQDI